MRINLKVDKDYWPRPGQCVAYKAGENILVRREFGEACIQQGIATEATPKSKKSNKSNEISIRDKADADGT